MATIEFGKPKITAEVRVRAEVSQAPQMATSTGEAFTPAWISVFYTRTNSQPWRFSRVVVGDGEVLGARVDVSSTRRKQVDAQPQWVRDFITQNLPGASS